MEEGGTRFNIDTTCNNFKYVYKLKNDNEDGGLSGYLHSCAPFMQRRATLTAYLRKVQRMASDADMLRISALAKVAEFRRLRYPVGLLYERPARTLVLLRGCVHGLTFEVFSRSKLW